jgi:nitrogen fixation protein FixH
MKTILIIVSIIGLSAVVGAIIVGSKTFDDIVVERPYEKGLAYDSIRKERAASGWNVEMASPSPRAGKSEIAFSVTGRDGRPLADATVSLFISRPSSPAYDRSYRTTRTDEGLFRTEIELPLYGYWDVKVLVASEGKNISFEKTFFAVKEENVKEVK